MKKFISFILSVSFLIMFASQAWARSEAKISIVQQDSITVGEDVILTVEVTDSDDNPLSAPIPTVAFSYISNVDDDVLYDCSDSFDMDECQPNNRGVVGVYESVFTLLELPLTVSFEVDGVTESIDLQEGYASTPVLVSAPAMDEGIDAELSEKPTLYGPAAPSDVQVGPSPSVWFILIPLALICFVLSMFVLSRKRQ